jgi:hypothetical protein
MTQAEIEAIVDARIEKLLEAKLATFLEFDCITDDGRHPPYRCGSGSCSRCHGTGSVPTALGAAVEAFALKRIQGWLADTTSNDSRW